MGNTAGFNIASAIYSWLYTCKTYGSLAKDTRNDLGRIVAAGLVVSLGYGRQLWSAYLDDVRGMWDMPRSVKLGWAVFFLIVAFQMAYAVLYEYYDGDDAYYIAVSVFADRFDTMYLRDAYSGYICPLDTRHAFSPMPIYQAWMSRLSGIAPAIVAHSVLAPVWLVFRYCV